MRLELYHFDVLLTNIYFGSALEVKTCPRGDVPSSSCVDDYAHSIHAAFTQHLRSIHAAGEEALIFSRARSSKKLPSSPIIKTKESEFIVRG